MERTPRARVDYFGSADAKDLLPMPPWGCRRRMVYRKAGVPVDDPLAYAAKFESEEGPIARGRKLEEVMRQEIRDRLQDQTCCRAVEESPQIGEVFAPDWLHAHPDGLLTIATSAVRDRLMRLLGSADEATGALLMARPGNVELKTVGFQDFFRITKDGPRDFDVVQCMHECASNGGEWCLLVYLNAEFWRYRFFLVRRDSGWERESYIPAAAELWNQCAVAKAAINLADSPDQWEPFLPERLPEGSKACSTCEFAGTCWGQEYLRVSAINPGEVERIEGDPTWDEAIRRNLEARALLDDAEFLKEDADAVLKNLMGDRVAVEAGAAKVTYKPQEGARKADGVKMADEALALAHAVETAETLDREQLVASLLRIAKLTKQSAGFRSLRVYPKKS